MNPSAEPNPFYSPNPFVPAAAPGATTMNASPVPPQLPSNARGVTNRKPRKTRSTFERRFLSERYRGGAGMLEIAALWRGNVVGVDSYREGKTPITLGTDDATYLVDTVPNTTVLAERSGRGWILHIDRNMAGFLVAPGTNGKSRRFSFTEAAAAGFAAQTDSGWRVSLSGDVRAKLVLGEQTFLVHFVSAPTLQLPLVARVGLAGLAIAIVASLVLHFVFGALVASSTDRVDELTLDRLATDSRFGQTLIQPQVTEEEELEPEELSEELEAADSDQTAEAQNGNTDVGENAGAMREGTATSDTLGGGKGGGDRVLDQNTLAFLNQLADGGPAAGDLSESMYSWNSFDGSDAQKPGTYVLGPNDTGKIGGRKTDTTGPGLPTGAKGDPDGDGTHPIATNTRDVLDDHVKETKKPTFRPGPVDSSGGLDKRIVRKIVNKHKREIRAMYERLLMKQKGAHGKIVITFIIDPSGNVASAVVKSSTFADKSLERSLVKALKAWRFPAAKNSVMTKVSYPFIFEVK